LAVSVGFSFVKDVCTVDVTLVLTGFVGNGEDGPGEILNTVPVLEDGFSVTSLTLGFVMKPGVCGRNGL